MRSNSSKKMNCLELLPDIKGYSPDTLWELSRNEGTKEECETILSWLERIYG